MNSSVTSTGAEADECVITDPLDQDFAVPDLIDRPALSVMNDWVAEGRNCALLTIIDIDGKSPRSIGAQMVVSANGDMHGYLTGGCLEGELSLVGQGVLEKGANKLFRYGKDSPFIDIKLPCGSGVDIYFDQGMDPAIVKKAAEMLAQRHYFSLRYDLEAGTTKLVELDAAQKDRAQEGAADNIFERLYKPILKLNLYGAGSAALQIGYFAKEAGMDLNFYCPDALTLREARKRGLDPVELDPNNAAPSDPWTASVLAFHEHEKEVPLLPQLLDGPDFYIGAVGSRKVAAQRSQDLAKAGIPQSQIDKLIQYPGLIPGARSATELGIGIVADILNTARQNKLVV